MDHVFGPVPSRRLGRSLGVDPVPLKTCNWNCVYCQLGRTRPVTGERKEWIPEADILAQIGAALDATGPDEIDWITFAGSGEPTLHSGLGRLVGGVKAMTDIPVAVLTNGALLYLPEVRRDLRAADAVMPSMAAGTDELFCRIHRPHGAAGFDRFLEGLREFRAGYDGQLQVEVMLLEGINDDDVSLRGMAAALAPVRPDGIDLVLPSRPPAETWIQSPGEEGLMRARAILAEVAPVSHPAEGLLDLSGCDDPRSAILAIVTRHPMSRDELVRVLGSHRAAEVDGALAQLEEDGRAQVVERHGTRFWSAAPAFFPDRERPGGRGD